jgi:hypothetical protein
VERRRLFLLVEQHMSTATMEPAAVTSEPTLWTLAETAKFLRIGEATLRAWMKVPGKLPAPKRFGQKWLFNSNEIKAMIEA